MRPAQLGELINAPSLGKVVKKMINQVPRVQLEASIQPLTRGLLRMDLILTPDFQWDQEQHGFVEPFLILVLCCCCQCFYYRCSRVLIMARFRYIEEFRVKTKV